MAAADVQMVESAVEDEDKESWMLVELGLLHAHCYDCYNRFCRVRPNDNGSAPDGVITCCPMTNCSLGCGAVYHCCKQAEHTHLCPYERVPCTNAAYGCPVIMQRFTISSHLEVCPASVIFCSIEWNRWPMHSMEEGVKAPLPLENRHLRCQQLDVALALRDQRMLIESRKAPRRTHRILRNSLTQRYPAAPFLHHSSSFDSDNLNSADTSRTVSDDDSDAPWDNAKSPPGLQRSVCSKLFRTLDEQSMNSFPNSLIKSSQDNNKSKADSPTKTKCVEDGHLKLLQLENEFPVICSHCKHRKSTSNEVFVEPSNSNCQQSECLNKDCSSEAHAASESLVSEPQTITHPQIEEISASELLSHLGPDQVCQAPVCDVSSKDGSVSRQVQAIKLNELLGVALNIECMTRYQAKPRSMFTFLCAQEFRRDEYAWHYKNVHNDIHCGLNGWQEQRCPLAHSGCTFSFRRFYPGQSKSRLVHSSLVESFGVKTSNCTDETMISAPYEVPPTIPLTMHCECKNQSQNKSLPGSREMTPEIVTSCQYDSLVRVLQIERSHEPPSPECDFLSMLPFEVLQQILRHVDSFSLCNLAITSKRLREACANLLEERGLVTQIWQKEVLEGSNKCHWKVAYKKWNFSPAFTPVKFWGFNGHNPLSEHLKVCPFNQDPARHSQPFHLPSDSKAATRLSHQHSPKHNPDEQQEHPQQPHPFYAQFDDVPELNLQV